MQVYEKLLRVWSERKEQRIAVRVRYSVAEDNGVTLVRLLGSHRVGADVPALPSSGAATRRLAPVCELMKCREDVP